MPDNNPGSKNPGLFISMSKNCLIISSFLLWSLVLSAQQLSESKLPEQVNNAFRTAQPAVRNPKWRIDPEGYRVDFKNVRNESCAFLYASDGNLLLSENNIAFEELPLASQRAIKGKKIKACKKIKDRKGKTTYSVRIGRKNLLFNAEGKTIAPH